LPFCSIRIHVHLGNIQMVQDSDVVTVEY